MVLGIFLLCFIDFGILLALSVIIYFMYAFYSVYSRQTGVRIANPANGWLEGMVYKKIKSVLFK